MIVMTAGVASVGSTPSSRIGHRHNQLLMESWFAHVQRGGLGRSGSLDLEFDTVPANSEREPLQKYYVSRRSRS